MYKEQEEEPYLQQIFFPQWIVLLNFKFIKSVSFSSSTHLTFAQAPLSVSLQLFDNLKNRTAKKRFDASRKSSTKNSKAMKKKHCKNDHHSFCYSTVQFLPTCLQKKERLIYKREKNMVILHLYFFLFLLPFMAAHLVDHFIRITAANDHITDQNFQNAILNKNLNIFDQNRIQVYELKF